MTEQATVTSSQDGSLASDLSDREVPLIARAEQKQTLKHQDLFLVCSATGDIRPDESNEEGLYFDGTRFLSRLILTVDGVPPVLLSSYVRDQNDQLGIMLTNDVTKTATTPPNILSLDREVFLHERTCYVSIQIQNFARETLDVALTMEFTSDYADIFEIRGQPRRARGDLLAPQIDGTSVTLCYRGLDQEHRETRITFSPSSVQVSASFAKFAFHLAPSEISGLEVSIACHRTLLPRAPTLSSVDARSLLDAHQRKRSQTQVKAVSSNQQFTEWFTRSQHDINLMTTQLPTGPYPYAGVPWFNTPFGRDGIITALHCLWMSPEIARGVLAYLAETQATEFNAAEDAEPEKSCMKPGVVKWPP